MNMDTNFDASDFSSPVIIYITPLRHHQSLHSHFTPDQVSTPVSPSISNQHIPVHTSMPATPVILTNAHEKSPVQEASCKYGLKFVGDNVDENVRPKHQTIENQTKSLHYFNCYACLDRVDLSGISDETPSVEIRSLNIETILPTSEDVDQLLSNFAVIANRILVKHVSAFPKLSKQTTSNINITRICLNAQKWYVNRF